MENPRWGHSIQVSSDRLDGGAGDRTRDPCVQVEWLIHYTTAAPILAYVDSTYVQPDPDLLCLSEESRCLSISFQKCLSSTGNGGPLGHNKDIKSTKSTPNVQDQWPSLSE